MQCHSLFAHKFPKKGALFSPNLNPKKKANGGKNSGENARKITRTLHRIYGKKVQFIGTQLILQASSFKRTRKYKLSANTHTSKYTYCREKNIKEYRHVFCKMCLEKAQNQKTKFHKINI